VSPRPDRELRCPYCRDALLAPRPGPIAFCAGCGTGAHEACVHEHGGCPSLGCAGGPAPEAPVAGGPTAVPWDELCRDAGPWLQLGAVLAERDAWAGPAGGPDWELVTDDPELEGSGSRALLRPRSDPAPE